MTAAVAAGFLAGAGGVLGAWDLLADADLDRLVGWVRRTGAPLRRAGTEGRAPTSQERRRLALLGAGCLAAAGWLVGGPLLAGLLAAVAPGATAMAVAAGREQYAAEVRRGAAPAARTMAGALAAGRTVRAAVAEAAAGLDGPAGREMRLASAALSLGEPTERVLERLRCQARGGPWNTLVAALLLQRDAGGDLARLLRDLAGSLEAAARAEREARSATAQSRLTARIVAVLPLIAAALAELATPGFLAGLAAHPVSLGLGIVAALLQAVALVLIRRIVR